MTSTTLSQSRTASQALKHILLRVRAYWTLIKDLQTGLLLVTAAAGYLSGCCLNLQAGSMAALMGSLFLAVSGSTVLNMVLDRDLDARMERIARRPLPASVISPWEAWLLGGLLTVGGLSWSFSLDPFYGCVVAGGVVLDVLVYTIWLKRRTPYSILFGGISGGMPILAGRVLATGQLDAIGVLLAAAILLWIPTHIMTFHIKYQQDYASAGVPTFPSVHGISVTRTLIAVSTIGTVVVLVAAGHLLSMSIPALIALGFVGLLLVGLVAANLVRPTQFLNFVLYKGASIYMLLAMMVFILGGI